MIAEIISVGTELLLGEVVNTNSVTIAKSLKEIGISLYNITTVGDNKKRLFKKLEEAYKNSDIIITTGGLGPTSDDITKETVCEFLNLELVPVEQEIKKLEQYFKHSSCSLNENNIKQAYFPKEAKIVQNKNGTADGCIIQNNGKITIILPGPPWELNPMLEETVIPYLKSKSDRCFLTKTVNVLGMGESDMEKKVMFLIKSQTNPTIAPYFKENGLQLRVMASADDEKACLDILKPVINSINDCLGQDIYAYGQNVSIEDVLSRYLIENNLSISTAESCTGGLVGAKIINCPGVSKVYKSGFITYSNEAKEKFLSVKHETLEKYGAVSKQTAIEMARGCALNSQSDIAISTTGIAGPGGGTKEKPVGLVYVGLYIKGKTYVKKLNLNGDREKIRKMATISALDFLRRTEKIPKYEFEEK